MKNNKEMFEIEILTVGSDLDYASMEHTLGM